MTATSKIRRHATIARTRRSIAALALAGVGMITVVSLPSPVHAAADVITVHVNGRTMLVVGTPGADVINITSLAGKISVGVDSSVTAGPGCVKPGPKVVDCTGTGSGSGSSRPAPSAATTR